MKSRFSPLNHKMHPVEMAQQQPAVSTAKGSFFMKTGNIIDV
tara:strand:+ start:13830 stop:13955 length:126 start_codon:yes stop_codon:yes gene_type:complete